MCLTRAHKILTTPKAGLKTSDLNKWSLICTEIRLIITDLEVITFLTHLVRNIIVDITHQRKTIGHLLVHLLEGLTMSHPHQFNGAILSSHHHRIAATTLLKLQDKTRLTITIAKLHHGRVWSSNSLLLHRNKVTQSRINITWNPRCLSMIPKLKWMSLILNVYQKPCC